MCVEVIQGMADTIAELERKIDFICEQLAQDFEIPCNFSPMDEIMLEDGRCEKDCGEIPESECWKRYFEVMQRREVRKINGKRRSNKGAEKRIANH